MCNRRFFSRVLAVLLVLTCVQVQAEPSAKAEEKTLTAFETEYNAAVALLESGKRDAAQQAFQQLLARPVQDAARETKTRGAAWNNLGTMALERGDLAGADKALAEAIKGFPAHAVAHNNIGALRLLQGNYKEAIAAYDAAIKANPRYVDALNNLAQLHVESRQYKVAGQVLLRAIQLKVANARTLMLLARIYDASGADRKLAENVREEWVKLVGGTAEGKARVAFAYLQIGVPVHARALLDAIRAETPGWAGLDLLEGRILSAEAKWKDAVAVLQRAAERTPADVAVRNDLVNALLKAGDAQGAVKAAEAGTRLAADNAQAWFLLGASQEAAGDGVGAESAYRRAATCAGAHPPALMNLAIIEATHERGDEAIRLLEAALQGDPYNPDIAYNLGRMLVISRRDYPRGIRLLGFAAQGQGDSAKRAKDFINRLYDGVKESSTPVQGQP